MKSKLRYELDDFGEVGITLKEFDSLKEMDEYLRKYKDSNEVKEEYFKEINAFLKTDAARKFLNNVPKTNRDNNGSLRGYTPTRYRLTRVPILFQSNLLPDEKCYTVLREKLNSTGVLADIYHRKYFLLPPSPTNFLKDELSHAVIHHGTKRIFIKEFILYIKSLKPEERYFVLRILCDKCKLTDDNRKKPSNKYHIKFDVIEGLKQYKLVLVRQYPAGKFSDEEIHEMSEETEPVYEVRDGAKEEFMMKDISTLLENYDIDEIDKNTDYFDRLEKGRKR